MGATVCDGRLETLALDVTSPQSVEAAAATVVAPLFGLVNNAGVGFGLPPSENLEVNLYGMKRCSDAFVPLIDAFGGGRVVNIASASGPNFVAKLHSADERAWWSDPAQLPTWKALEEKLAPYKVGRSIREAHLG